MPTTKDDRYWLQVTPVKYNDSHGDKWEGYIPEVDRKVHADGTDMYVYHVRAGQWVALLVRNLKDVDARFDLASQHECEYEKWHKTEAGMTLEPHDEGWSSIFRVVGHVTDWYVRDVEKKILLHLQFVSVPDVCTADDGGGEKMLLGSLLRQLLDAR